MIICKLKDLKRYKGINSNLDTAIEYLIKNDLKELSTGRTEIDGDKVFINRFSYKGLPENECFFEGHNDYLDIHIVLDGEELLGYSDIYDLEAITDYDKENDFTKYKGKVKTYCRGEIGTFIIVFPEDIHMPKIRVNENVVEKVVCKVLIK